MFCMDKKESYSLYGPHKTKVTIDPRFISEENETQRSYANSLDHTERKWWRCYL